MENESPVVFDFQELATVLIKEKGIHEGLWGVFVRFSMTAANVSMKPSGDVTSTQLYPTALIPVVELGIQKFDEPSNLTVDAAKVNPIKVRSAPKKKAKSTR